MNVLICGARGFTGQAIGERLGREGHCIIEGVRRADGANEMAMDFSTDSGPSVWEARLEGIDVVINAVGILTERGKQTFQSIHADAPVALFEACRRRGIGRVIQISALGAQDGDSAYFRSKCIADRKALSLGYRIVRPALVYGASGTSASGFRALASLPVHALPAGGKQLLRPIHIDDLTDAIAHLVEERATDSRVIDLVGAEEVTYGEMLAIYRHSMGLSAAFTISIPASIMSIAAALCGYIPGSPLTRDTWKMLQAGNTADMTATSALLGRKPRGVSGFIARRETQASWRDPVLRASLTIVWIWTALVSAFVYPREDSLALLSRVHLHGATAVVALYAASALDLVFGIATLLRPGRRLWMAQALLISAYSIIIALAIPETLIEPFGPILKNLPILAVLFILFNEESRA